MAETTLAFECPYAECVWPACYHESLQAVLRPLCSAAVVAAQRQHVRTITMTPVKVKPEAK